MGWGREFCSAEWYFFAFSLSGVDFQESYLLRDFFLARALTRGSLYSGRVCPPYPVKHFACLIVKRALNRLQQVFQLGQRLWFIGVGA